MAESSKIESVKIEPDEGKFVYSLQEALGLLSKSGTVRMATLEVDKDGAVHVGAVQEASSAEDFVGKVTDVYKTAKREDEKGSTSAKNEGRAPRLTLDDLSKYEGKNKYIYDDIVRRIRLNLGKGNHERFQKGTDERMRVEIRTCTYSNGKPPQVHTTAFRSLELVPVVCPSMIAAGPHFPFDGEVYTEDKEVLSVPHLSELIRARFSAATDKDGDGNSVVRTEELSHIPETFVVKLQRYAGNNGHRTMPLGYNVTINFNDCVHQSLQSHQLLWGASGNRVYHLVAVIMHKRSKSYLVKQKARADDKSPSMSERRFTRWARIFVRNHSSDEESPDVVRWSVITNPENTDHMHRDGTTCGELHQETLLGVEQGHDDLSKQMMIDTLYYRRADMC